MVCLQVHILHEGFPPQNNLFACQNLILTEPLTVVLNAQVSKMVLIAGEERHTYKTAVFSVCLEDRLLTLGDMRPRDSLVQPVSHVCVGK